MGSTCRGELPPDIFFLGGGGLVKTGTVLTSLDAFLLFIFCPLQRTISLHLGSGICYELYFVVCYITFTLFALPRRFVHWSPI